MVRRVLAMLGGALVGLVLAVGLGIVVAIIGFSGSGPAVGGHGEPREKAAALGRAISEAMNCSAAAAMILVPGGAFVIWRRQPRRRL